MKFDRHVLSLKMLLRHILIGFGVISTLGATAPADAAIEHERKALEARVAGVRDVIMQKKNENNPCHVSKSLGEKLAQWYPWGNWRNWRNW